MSKKLTNKTAIQESPALVGESKATLSQELTPAPVQNTVNAVNYRDLYERNQQRLNDISNIKEELAADMKAIRELFVEFSKNVGLPTGDTLIYFIKNRKAIFKLLKSIVLILTKKGQKI